jgi:hypothetical protein
VDVARRLVEVVFVEAFFKVVFEVVLDEVLDVDALFEVVFEVVFDVVLEVVFDDVVFVVFVDFDELLVEVDLLVTDATMGRVQTSF